MVATVMAVTTYWHRPGHRSGHNSEATGLDTYRAQTWAHTGESHNYHQTV